MNFFDKILKKIVKISQKEEQHKDTHQDEEFSVDELFVKKFIHKGGKFLYCSDLDELEKNLI